MFLQPSLRSHLPGAFTRQQQAVVMNSVTALVFCCSLAVSLATHSHQRPDQDGKFPQAQKTDNTEQPQPDADTYIDIGGIASGILTPKYAPGEVIDKTNHKDVDGALGEVLKAGGIMNDRRCAVAVVNSGGAALTNPRWWLYSGSIWSSAPYTIHSGKTGLVLFYKREWQLYGSVGVLTYELEGSDKKVAILFSVPFDFNRYDVWYNIKVYPQSYQTEEDMWDQMYYNAGPWRAVGWEERTEHGVHIRATMTDNIQAKVAVWVESSGINDEGAVELATGCSYSGKWVGKYCWSECHPRQWCWVNSGCGGGCKGPLKCHESCT